VLAAGVAATVTACARPLPSEERMGDGEQVPEASSSPAPVAGPGRLTARPPASAPSSPAPAGLTALGLAEDRDALLYVPASTSADRPAPLAVSLHGAGGDAQGGLDLILPLADDAGLVLVAPPSRGRTWDVILGGFGPDVAFLDAALAAAFERVVIDPARIGVAGFSDGASYALSLGLTNGDLFGQVTAFSPGFAAPADRVGRPRVFVSHGVGDPVLPIDRCSRRIVPALRRQGYDVRYEEFDGGHTVPPDLVAASLDQWLGGDPIDDGR
jgi:predicted esterase